MLLKMLSHSRITYLCHALWVSTAGFAQWSLADNHTRQKDTDHDQNIETHYCCQSSIKKIQSFVCDSVFFFPSKCLNNECETAKVQRLWGGFASSTPSRDFKAGPWSFGMLCWLTLLRHVSTTFVTTFFYFQNNFHTCLFIYSVVSSQLVFLTLVILHCSCASCELFNCSV